MASNPHVDLSGDIRDFRRVLCDTLTQKLYDLAGEEYKTQLLLERGPDMLKVHIPDEYIRTGRISALRTFDDPYCASVFRISHPELFLPYEDAVEIFPVRKKLIESLIKNSALDRCFVRDCFLLRSTLQYAVIKKEITTLNRDYDVIRTYKGDLPSTEEIAVFLFNLFDKQKKLTRDLLIRLSDRYGSRQIFVSVCNNQFMTRLFPDGERAKMVIADSIVGLGNNLLAFRKDMNAIMVALDNRVLEGLNNYLSEISINRDTLSLIDFPLNEEKIKSMRLFSTYPEDKEECIKALEGVLKEAGERGLFSPSELSVITEKTTVLTVDTNSVTLSDGETIAQTASGQPVSREKAPSAIQSPIPSPLLPGYTVEEDTIPKEVDVVPPSIPLAIAEPDPESRSIPKRYRVTRPPRFKGELGERAFLRLYDLMKDVYFECYSPENFAGLFRCPANEEIELYTKIDWIHDDGITGLQCFIEALYRSDEYAIAPVIPKGKLSSIFLVNGVRKKLSNNSLYCWGKDKHIVNNNDQEKKIRKYLELIDKSFKEPKERQ